jgi:hypothetical protein
VRDEARINYTISNERNKFKNYISQSLKVFPKHYIWFGKHTGSSFDWIKKNDIKYYNWLLASEWVQENKPKLYEQLLTHAGIC